MSDATQTKRSLGGVTHSVVQCAARQPVFFGIGLSATGLFCVRTTDEGQRPRQDRGIFVSSDEATSFGEIAWFLHHITKGHSRKFTCKDVNRPHSQSLLSLSYDLTIWLGGLFSP